MIVAYSRDETDFEHNGLGPLEPVSCEVSEVLNGEWALTLKHTREDAVKCARLQIGNIIRAPVPAGFTPVLTHGEGGTEIYRVRIYDPGSHLLLRQKPSTSSPILGRYELGVEVVVLNAHDSERDADWYECATPDGKHGYMHSAYLVYVRTEDSPEAAEGTVKEPKPLRDQLFRIAKIEPELDSVTVYARHIFYDLMDNLVGPYKVEGATGEAAAQGILANCRGEHSFVMHSDLTGTGDADFTDKNPVEALLGSEGLCEVWKGELARDWWDVYAVQRVGRDTDVVVRQGKDLLALSGEMDVTNVMTRIVPVGQTKDGEPLYLPEVYVENEDDPQDYGVVKWGKLDVSEAKVGKDGMTQAQAFEKMREAAREEFEKGCDAMDYTLEVDFVNLGRVEEYAQYAALYDLGIGDGVRVISERAGVDTTLRLTEYTYDCLSRRYTSMRLGTVEDDMSTVSVTGRQLANGSVSGAKITRGAVGAGQLASESVTSAKIALAAIQAAHIGEAQIKTAAIDDAAITSAKIGSAAVTTAKIKDAAITSAKIGSAAVTTAKIKDAAITTAKIGDAQITSAKIGTGEIKTANIEDGTITSAKIGTGQIGTAHIEDLAVTTAKIGAGAITSAKIGTGEIKTANIEDAAITSAKIGSAAVGTAAIDDAAITEAKIAAEAVTSAKIHDAAITTAKIQDGQITTAKIGDAQITGAKIGSAAIDTGHIKDAAITSAKIVSLNADVITSGTLATERLIIKGADGLIYEINAQASGLTPKELTDDKYKNLLNGTVIVARSVTADQIAAGTITGAEIKAGTLTTSHVSSEFGASLDLSSNTGINQRVEKVYADMDAVATHGRNLALGTAQPISMSAVGVSPTYYLLSDYGHDITAGDTTGDYTISMDWTFTWTGEGEPAEITGDPYFVYRFGGSQAWGSRSQEWPHITSDKLSGRVESVVHLSEMQAARSTKYIEIRLRATVSGYTLTVSNLKFEKGTRATEWTEAPEEAEDALETQLQSINARISNMGESIQSEVRASYALKSDLQATAQTVQTLSQQTQENFTWSVAQINQLLGETEGLTEEQARARDTLQTMLTYMRFDQNGMTIGKSGSELTLRATNDRLSFYSNETEVAYISNNRLFITEAQILTRMTLGRFGFEPQSNGNLSLIFNG